VSGVPRISSRECINALVKVGFYVDRQRGSNIVLKRDYPRARTVVPQRRELAAGTLRAIRRDANLSVEELASCYEQAYAPGCRPLFAGHRGGRGALAARS
jgi:predicted RNA binding protein YcfA (HicA-like mRNA interferase family)